MVDKSESVVERFRRLERLYHSALTLTAAERQAFFDHACADDDALRREVETLLAAQPQAAEFLSVPVIEREARRRVAQLSTQIPNDNQPVAPPVSLIGCAINQYQIVAPLGKGGMGEVWLAEDVRLKRKVALKLLPTEFTNDADRVRRFEQEAHAVSALNHPNIITLFDFGQTNEGYFITTEFVDGQTLRARLREEARLPVREALELARQICAALAAAHAAGIIHRDLKPENLMLRHDGYVKVLDFGLAKMSEGQTLELSTSPSSLTNPGTVLGTVSYMSPEQARGQKVDARTDIFSLGIVLYEMLAGHLPFEGETISDMLAAILKSEPLPLSDALTDAPAALQQIITQALVKDREARYQTVQALADDLQQCAETLQFQTRLARSGETGQPVVTPLPAAAAVHPSSNEHGASASRASRLKLGALVLATLLIASLVCLLVWRMLKPEPSTPAVNAPIKTIAVLPFRFLGSERAEEYLGLGMTESLITKLSSARQLTVRPTSAVLKYQSSTKGASVEPERAARELQADAVLEGSVQKVGDKLRVTVQLIRAGDAQRLWADEFNESVNDLFTLQDKLAARVTQELALRLTGAEQQQLAKRATTNPAAWRLYLQGRYFHNKRTTEGIRQARSFYQRALALEPKFAAAHSALARSWVDLAELGGVPLAEGSRQALALAAKAVELDDTLAEAHAYLGYLRLAYAWDLPGAETGLRRALDLDPQQMDTRQWHGVYLLARGRAAEAVAETRRAVELDPASLHARAQLGRALYLGRRYDEVIATCQELLQMDEHWPQAYVWLGQAYAQQGKHADASAALEKASSLDAGKPETKAALGHAYAVAGRVEEARMIIRDLQGRSEFAGKTYYIATIYAALGTRAAALAQLEEAFQRRDPALMLRSKLDPKLDPLRSEPDFTALLQRLGVAQ